MLLKDFGVDFYRQIHHRPQMHEANDGRLEARISTPLVTSSTFNPFKVHSIRHLFEPSKASPMSLLNEIPRTCFKRILATPPKATPRGIGFEKALLMEHGG